MRRCMQRNLRQDGALFLDLATQAFVLGRIRPAQAAPKYRNRAAAGCKRTPMRSRVGAPSQAADDCEADRRPSVP